MPSSHLAQSSGGSGISLGRAAVVAAVEDPVAVEDLGEVVAVGGGEGISESAAAALEAIGQHKAELTPLCQR